LRPSGRLFCGPEKLKKTKIFSVAEIFGNLEVLHKPLDVTMVRWTLEGHRHQEGKRAMRFFEELE
jgi:hypothetical protein